MPDFYMIFTRKWPEFYIIFARKMFSRFFALPICLAPPSPVSIRLCRDRLASRHSPQING